MRFVKRRAPKKDKWVGMGKRKEEDQNEVCLFDLRKLQPCTLLTQHRACVAKSRTELKRVETRVGREEAKESKVCG